MSAALKKARERVKSLKSTLRTAENYVKKEMTKMKAKKTATKKPSAKKPTKTSLRSRLSRLTSRKKPATKRVAKK